MDETKALAAFGATTTYEDIPPAVIAKMKQLLLDQIACQVDAARLPWSLAVHDGVATLASTGPSTVVVHGTKLPIDEAAFVNAAFGHGNEVDDAHMTVRTHPGAVIVPTLLAFSETDDGIDGSMLLAAGTIGCEVMLRVAYASMPALMDVRHHNTPSSAGPFGGATAAGRLLGLSTEGIEQALGVAGYHSAGLMQYTESGGSVKRIQTSIGAKGGIRAAMLAAAGVTGPGEILEGARGFLAAFAGPHELSRLTDGLGERYLLPGTCFKRFNVKYRLHASIDGLLALCEREHLEATQIAAIHVGVSEPSRQLVGITARPTNTVEAQLSMKFALATAAIRGPAALGEFGPEEFNDPELLDLAGRVEVYREPEQERESWMNWGCVLTVETHDGQVITDHVPAPRGSPDNPMSEADMIEKFHRLVDPVLGSARAVEIMEVVAKLESTVPGRDLIPLLIA